MLIWLVVETSKPIRENIHTPHPPPPPLLGIASHEEFS